MTEYRLPTYARELFRPHRRKVLYGGRGSSKSWSIAAALVIQAHQNPLRIACVREHQKSIQESAKRTLELMIARFGLGSAFTSTRDNIRHTNGSFFFFGGMSTVSEEDIRGWEDVDRVWVEEAHRVSHSSWEILRNTIRKPGSEIWGSLNPKNRYDPFYRDFVVRTQEDAWVCKVNFTDNPWFPRELEIERQADLRDNPERYPHLWLGEPDDVSDARKVLPYALLQQCVDAWPRRPLDAGVAHAGLDVADTGGDKNAFTLRRGPNLTHAERWSAKTLGRTAARTDKLCNEHGAVRLYFDAGGPGAGIRSHLVEDVQKRSYGFHGVQFGGSVLGEDVSYLRGASNKEYFFNRAAQMGWGVRIRANYTARLMDGENVPLDRCLFVNPAIEKLEDVMAQCAQPEWSDDAGKLKVDKQPREIGQPKPASPDAYDSIILAFSADSRRGLRRPT